MTDHSDIDSVSGTATTGHQWDGIKELNTPLPRWWVYTFYLTIISYTSPFFYGFAALAINEFSGNLYCDSSSFCYQYSGTPPPPSLLL